MFSLFRESAIVLCLLNIAATSSLVAFAQGADKETQNPGKPIGAMSDVLY